MTCSAEEEDACALAELDMPSGHAYAKALRTVKTCCRLGVAASVCRLDHMGSAGKGAVG